MAKKTLAGRGNQPTKGKVIVIGDDENSSDREVKREPEESGPHDVKELQEKLAKSEEKVAKLEKREQNAIRTAGVAQSRVEYLETLIDDKNNIVKATPTVTFELFSPMDGKSIEFTMIKGDENREKVEELKMHLDNIFHLGLGIKESFEAEMESKWEELPWSDVDKCPGIIQILNRFIFSAVWQQNQSAKKEKQMKTVPEKKKEDKKVTERESMEAYNGVVVWCDACESCLAPSIGGRHKCLQCADYDLCTSCNEKGKHGHDGSHSFVHLKEAENLTATGLARLRECYPEDFSDEEGEEMDDDNDEDYPGPSKKKRSSDGGRPKGMRRSTDCLGY